MCWGEGAGGEKGHVGERLRPHGEEGAGTGAGAAQLGEGVGQSHDWIIWGAQEGGQLPPLCVPRACMEGPMPPNLCMGGGWVTAVGLLQAPNFLATALVLSLTLSAPCQGALSMYLVQ